jgi:hypothetical protein
MRVRLVVYHRGRRIEKRYEEHTEAATMAKKLRRKGVKFALVTARVAPSRRFPPDGDDLSARRAEGMLWCPYCGAWRWFKVPKFTPGAEVWTEAWFMNSFHRQEIKVCGWCRISEYEFEIRMVNGTFSEQRKRRRRKRRVR